MKRNTLTTAVLAGLTGMAGMVSVSNAVNVNPDGLGQVLLYPFYTARGGNDTAISIVNTTDRGKAVKIRVLEALNSREVLDFNIYMSEWDVWTGVITAEGDTSAKIRTSDKTCTAPNIFSPAQGLGIDANGDGTVDYGEIEFLDFQYTGLNTDYGPQGQERVMSGHLEFIEMGAFVETPLTGTRPSGEGEVPWSAKHVGGPNGEPRDCELFDELWSPGAPNNIWFSGNVVYGFETEDGGSQPVVRGGLFGGASIIDGESATMFSYNATAIDAFWQRSLGIHSNPSLVTPALNSGGNRTSNVFVNGSVATHDWDDSIFAVNATVTYETLMNEYNIEAGVAGRSEWVLTFPTKRFHADAQAPIGLNVPNFPIAPFSNTWHDPDAGGPAPLNLPCEALSFRVWDREEFEPTPETGEVIPSPPPPTPEPNVFQLCRETNVVRFTGDGTVPDETEILKEPLRSGAFERLSYANFDLPEGFEAGWVRFDLTNIPSGASIATGASADVLAGTRLSPAAVGGVGGFGAGDQVEGLPVIGFWVNTFTFGDRAADDMSVTRYNYGGTFNHHGSRAISFGDTVID